MWKLARLGQREHQTFTITLSKPGTKEDNLRGTRPLDQSRGEDGAVRPGQHRAGAALGDVRFRYMPQRRAPARGDDDGDQQADAGVERRGGMKPDPLDQGA